MKGFTRSTSALLRTLPHRQSWHNLGAYAVARQSAEAWKRLRSRDTKIDELVGKYKEDSLRPTIDWDYWEKNIGHKEIVQSMRSFYEQQKSLLNAVIGEDHKEALERKKEGWTLFDQAISSCESSVETSENLVANGARGLWVSYHNPPLPKISDAEWLDSDPGWQAVVEKQFLYNPTASVAEEDLPKWKQVLRNGWRHKMDTFNARSDTPVLYQYMDQLPSWEYYDIHRRAFLEHMVYYLLRTGGDYRLFPECPPSNWLADIEELRYQFIAVSQRRRAAFQLSGEHREMALDLDASDEARVTKLLTDEAIGYEQLAARMMANYCFLCHPYIPVQTERALYRVLSKYSSSGRLFTLGDDVNALFFLPKAEPGSECPLPSPREAYNALLDHCALTGRCINPSYAEMLNIQTQVLEKRGQDWFTVPGELVCDAFMRRLQKNDPSYHIYSAYVKELKDRFEKAQEVVDIAAAMQKVEDNYRSECELFSLYQHSTDPRYMEESQKEVDRLSQLGSSGSLQALLDEGSLVAVLDAGETHRVTDSRQILADIVEQSEMRQFINECVKNLKLEIPIPSTVGGVTTVHKPVSELTRGRDDMVHLEGHLKHATDK